MLAKLTSKNQLTLPKAIVQQIDQPEYFDVSLEDGRIVLTPMQPPCLQSRSCKRYRPALPCALAFKAFCRRKRKGDAVLDAGAHCTPIRYTVCRLAMLVFSKRGLCNWASIRLSISCWT